MLVAERLVALLVEGLGLDLAVVHSVESVAVGIGFLVLLQSLRG